MIEMNAPFGIVVSFKNKKLFVQAFDAINDGKMDEWTECKNKYRK